jgi:hypothetical protein
MPLLYGDKYKDQCTDTDLKLKDMLYVMASL